MKFEPTPSLPLLPPFDSIQLSEYEHPGELRGPLSHLQSEAPFFDLASRATRRFVMYHDLAPISETGATTRGGLAPWQLRQAKAMLSAHIRKNVSLQELADACHLSKSHFLREFKQSTGHTPHHWAVLHSVAMAAELLVITRLSVGQVALASGFANISHLSRWFKRVIGVGPKSWQKTHSRVHKTPAPS